MNWSKCFLHEGTTDMSWRHFGQGFLQLKTMQRGDLVSHILLKLNTIFYCVHILHDRLTHFLLNAAEELEHGDIDRGLGHSQGQTDALQLHKHLTSPSLLSGLLGLVHQDHPRRLQLRDKKG